MNYLPRKSDTPVPEHFLGADVLRSVSIAAPEDPIVAWLDLMEVVEALCPVWPERCVGRGGQYRL